jgi:hypothetical protein
MQARGAGPLDSSAKALATSIAPIVCPNSRAADTIPLAVPDRVNGAVRRIARLLQI